MQVLAQAATSSARLHQTYLEETSHREASLPGWAMFAGEKNVFSEFFQYH
jgi:hypothetical protein